MRYGRAVKSLAEEFHRVHNTARPILGTCIYGLVASISAVGFQLAINYVYDWAYKAPAHTSTTRFLVISFAVIVSTSLITGWLLTSFAPSAAGSGIPQVKLNFWKEFGRAPKRIALVKFVAGVLCIGGGQSLGREGPTVQIGSNLSSTISGWLGVTKQNRRAASAAGAAAGLAAAFNAPLASIAFVLEEIIGDLNSRSLGPVLLAAVIGAFVVHAFIGAQPAFVLPQIGEPTWRAYLLMPFAAGFAALIGVFFQRGSLWLRARMKKFRPLPRWLHPLAGGLITWGIGVAVFLGTARLGVFALGYEDLSDALTHGFGWQLALAMLAGKLIATIACYGLGGCGGIFSPNLFFGAMCGALVASMGGQFLSLNESDTLLLAVGGMSACLGAVVLAPVTAILIIFEMTHQFALVPGLMLAGLISQVIARSINHINFYDALLCEDGHDLDHLIPPRDLRSWQNLPISALANFKPVVVSDPSEPALAELLEKHPYRHFPVVENGNLTGVAPRSEIANALAAHRSLKLEPAMICRPGQSIRESQTLLIQSTTGTVAISDDGSKLLGIVTLHDLLRAQLSMAEREGSG
ncbi:MAG: chloride channel protein [Verrucomicrobiota bacterium]|nr:chloride channel protein [Verrucomicrobiota bacterium]